MSKINENSSVVQVKIPLPFPLRWVNAYLLRGRYGYTVIDPGLHTPETEQVWNETLENMQLTFKDINQIVLTHHHPDHYGMAGWFQERSAATVWLSATGSMQSELLWGENSSLNDQIRQLFLQHGMDNQTTAQMIPHMDSFLPMVSPQPQLTISPDMGTFHMGDRSWQIIRTDGHAAGHLCFYDPVQRELFCGDHVIPQISPNISYLPGIDANPLASFLRDLVRIGEYDVALAYPGHREPFTNFRGRVEELLEHHNQRVKAMYERLSEPKTSYMVCLETFGSKLSIHQLRFAMSETIAHLVYMKSLGMITEREVDGVLVYKCS